MSLLQNLPYKEYQKALRLSREQCERISTLAKIRYSHYQHLNKPGEQLVKDLDRRGYSVQQYMRLLCALSSENKTYKPQSKVAILIGNNDYKYLSKLATPIMDCATLSENLKSIGFIVIEIRNVTASVLKEILCDISSKVPHESYCFIFYAGHGFELNQVKYAIGVESPNENISPEHVLSEKEILNAVSKCRPEFSILLMDMCRLYLEQELNKNLWEEHKTTKEHSIKNLVIGYSTQSAMSAYEEIQLELSKTIDNMQTYELRTCDLDKIIPGSSQYVDTLCRHIRENIDVAMLLDRVHSDLENAVKKQTPSKVQIGTVRSLHDPYKGDKKEIIKSLRSALSKYQDICAI